MNSSRYATAGAQNPTSPTSPTSQYTHRNGNVNANTNTTPSTSTPNNVFSSSIALADLGSARFNHDTAEATDRDVSLMRDRPTTLRQGRAPKGLEDQAFAWSTFQFTTEERDEREEMKGELHDGVLHRLNREARGENSGGVREEGMGGYGGRGGRGGGRGRGGRWGRAAGEQQRDDGRGDALCAGRKMGGNGVPPLAKGMSEEMDKSMFWDGPIA